VKSDADIVVTGEGFSEMAGRVGKLVSVKARLEIKAVNRRTGRVVAVDRQTVIALETSEQIAGKTALQNAAAEIAVRLLPKLVAVDGGAATEVLPKD
jgi:ribosome maturation factor RimP